MRKRELEQETTKGTHNKRQPTNAGQQLHLFPLLRLFVTHRQCGTHRGCNRNPHSTQLKSRRRGNPPAPEIRGCSYTSEHLLPARCSIDITCMLLLRLTLSGCHAHASERCEIASERSDTERRDGSACRGNQKLKQETPEGTHTPVVLLSSCVA